MGVNASPMAVSKDAPREQLKEVNGEDKETNEENDIKICFLSISLFEESVGWDIIFQSTTQKCMQIFLHIASSISVLISKLYVKS